MQGILQNVDQYMNTELTDARIWSIYHELDQINSDDLLHLEQFTISTQPDADKLAKQPVVDYVFIKGSRIRYFFVPEGTDIMTSIQNQLSVYQRRGQASAPNANRPFNWKSYRKKQKLENMQTLQQQQSTSGASTSRSDNSNVVENK